jgi:hypothetical protein
MSPTATTSGGKEGIRLPGRLSVYVIVNVHVRDESGAGLVVVRQTYYGHPLAGQGDRHG